MESAGPYASLHLTTLFFTGQMPFLPPNQQRQSTEGMFDNIIHENFQSNFGKGHIAAAHCPCTWIHLCTHLDLFPDKTPIKLSLPVRRIFQYKVLWTHLSLPQMASQLLQLFLLNTQRVRKDCICAVCAGYVVQKCSALMHRLPFLQPLCRSTCLSCKLCILD